MLRPCRECASLAKGWGHSIRAGRNLFQRGLAVAADSSEQQQVLHQATDTGASDRAYIDTAVILQRPSLITRELDPFEKEYYQYQRALAAKRAAPFAGSFFFKKDSVAEKRWMAAESERRKGNEVSRQGAVLTALDKEYEETEVEAKSFKSRRTEADEKGDTKSLDRALDQSLYYVVKGSNPLSEWHFPSKRMEQPEALYKMVEPILSQYCGNRLQYWLVSRTPAAVLKHAFEPEAETQNPPDTRRPGTAHPNEENPVQDWAWLTKDELLSRMSPKYGKIAHDILTRR